MSKWLYLISKKYQSTYQSNYDREATDEEYLNTWEKIEWFTVVKFLLKIIFLWWWNSLSKDLFVTFCCCVLRSYLAEWDKLNECWWPIYDVLLPQLYKLLIKKHFYSCK